MSQFSKLKIKDWKEDKIRKVNIENPKLISYLTTHLFSQGKFTANIFYLKYLNKEAEFNVNEINSKICEYEKDEFIPGHTELSIAKKCIEDYPNWICTKDIEFITTLNVICDIMNASFIKRNLILEVRVKDKKLYIEPIIYSSSLPYFLKYREFLKQYLSVKKPEFLFSNVTSTMDKQFYEVYQLNVGDHKLMYAFRDPVIDNDRVTGFKDLEKAEHVYCDIFETGQFTDDIINYNPIWWANATLINAKQYIIGAFNKDNRLVNIFQFTSDKYDDKTKYENLWSPDAAWDFLDNFLTFVKYEVNRVYDDYKNKCIWRFNFEDCVTCTPVGVATVFHGII